MYTGYILYSCSCTVECSLVEQNWWWWLVVQAQPQASSWGRHHPSWFMASEVEAVAERLVELSQ